MTHLHIYSYTQSSFWINCVMKEFTLNIIIQHIRDEDVSDYHFFSIFEFTIFRQFFQNAVELFYSFSLFLFSWEKHVEIKGEVSGTNESYFHHLPEFEASEIVDVIMRKFLC